MADAIYEGEALPVAAKRTNSTGWWGMLCLIATEGSLFAYLLFSYFFIAIQRGGAWLAEPHPSWSLAGPNTLILLLSSVAAWWGESGARRGDMRRGALGLVIAMGLGIVFLVVQYFEWTSKSFSLQSGSYGSSFFVITGFHMAHVVVGVLVLAAVALWTRLGLFTRRRHEPVSIAVIYWHFVDVVWLAVFTTFYVTPYLMSVS